MRSVKLIIPALFIVATNNLFAAECPVSFHQVKLPTEARFCILMQESAPAVMTMHLPHAPLQARNLIESHNVDAQFTQLNAESVEIKSNKKRVRMVIREDINGSHVSIISI